MLNQRTNPNYDFDLDLPIAVKSENEVSSLFKQYYNFITTKVSCRKGYDLLIENGEESFKIEVKEDFTCERTGNVGVEFRCRGKDSGIRTTIADYYVYKIHTKWGIEFYMIKVQTLRYMIEKQFYHRVVVGGDPGSNSMNYLFHLETLRKYARRVFQ